RKVSLLHEIEKSIQPKKSRRVFFTIPPIGQLCHRNVIPTNCNALIMHDIRENITLSGLP
ncbi:MAG: hypothetical protein EZS28_042530, partial [Streblomastix strix]